MRVFLNNILSFIGSESLTDVEFSTIESTAEEYSKQVYEELKAILQARESVSGQLKKLKAYFMAKDVDLTTTPARDQKSQILIGGPL